MKQLTNFLYRYLHKQEADAAIRGLTFAELVPLMAGGTVAYCCLVSCFVPQFSK